MKITARIFSDFFLIFFAIGMILGFHSYFLQFFAPIETKVDIVLDLIHLPLYTFFSLSRGLAAYALSLAFSIVVGYWAAKDRLGEKILVPFLDILQSIPILGFLPGVVLFFISVFPKTNVGLELAAILLMFTGQVWNMVFGVYHSVRTVPEDRMECAAAYSLTGWQKATWIEIPFATLSLVWNSIMSMAGGWFFLMVNEAFTLGNRDFRIPGLGSYMSVAASQENNFAIASAIIAMVALIVFLDQILWRPLVVWSQKFRIEETGPAQKTTTWFLVILKYSFLIQFLKSVWKGGCKIFQNLNLHHFPKKGIAPLIASRFFLLLILLSIAWGSVYLFSYLSEIDIEKWIHLGKMAGLTLSRVFVSMFFSILIALPLGLSIGLSEKWSQILEPVVQVGASFPATLLFPILVLLLKFLNIPLGVGSIALMFTGTVWYILYNVIAGAKAMPSDLREVAVNFRLGLSMRFFKLYLPAIFPYLATGLFSAAGGAWNASIVSEFVNYKGQTWSTAGIGSTISIAAAAGDIPLLAASVLVMMSVVVALNYGIWQRLYHYSEKHFEINT